MSKIRPTSGSPAILIRTQLPFASETPLESRRSREESHPGLGAGCATLVERTAGDRNSIFSRNGNTRHRLRQRGGSADGSPRMAQLFLYSTILSFARALFSLVFLSPPGTREFLKSDGCRVEGGIGVPRDISFIPRANSQLNCTPFYRDIFIPRGIKSSVAAKLVYI